MSFGHGSQTPNPSGSFSSSCQGGMGGGLLSSTGTSFHQGGSQQAGTSTTSGPSTSWLESVPMYLRTDPNVLHMAEVISREEEKQRRLKEEIRQGLEEAARGTSS